MNYNSSVKVILFYLISLTLIVNASRVSVDLTFEDLPVLSDYVPFSVIAPNHIKGEFIRFIHPRNGKSAVAKIIKSEGDIYKASAELASVIGVNNLKVATVYAEEVY